PERRQQVVRPLDVGFLVLLGPASEHSVGCGEDEVADDLRSRCLLCEVRGGEADAGAQLEDVDPAQLLLKQLDGARRRVHAGARELQQRRLACAVGAQHDPVLPLTDRQAQIVQEMRLAATNADSIEFHHCTHMLHSILPAMLTTTPLLPVLFATASTARLTDRAAPDTVPEAFIAAGLPVPLIVSDTVFAPPAGTGAEVPAGLLLWVAGLRRAGAVRVRAEPVHPSLPLRVPRMDRDARRATARASART